MGSCGADPCGIMGRRAFTPCHWTRSSQHLHPVIGQDLFGEHLHPVIGQVLLGDFVRERECPPSFESDFGNLPPSDYTNLTKQATTDVRVMPEETEVKEGSRFDAYVCVFRF